jgi:hypothetical protein
MYPELNSEISAAAGAPMETAVQAEEASRAAAGAPVQEVSFWTQVVAAGPPAQEVSFWAQVGEEHALSAQVCPRAQTGRIITLGEERTFSIRCIICRCDAQDDGSRYGLCSSCKCFADSLQLVVLAAFVGAAAGLIARNRA